jgi:integrase
MENEKANEIIEQINEVLKTQHKTTITKLYETLVARGIVEPDTRKNFENLLEYALECKIVDKNKIKRYKNKKNQLADVFSNEDLVKLFDSIDRPKLAIASAVTFFCGLRISEVCKLKIEDIDLQSLRLKVVDAKNSRRHLSGYGKDRYVPLPKVLISPIKKWLDIIGGGKWFLPSHKSPDKHIRPKTLHEEFRVALDRAGLLIPKFTLNFKQRINNKWVDKTATRHKYYFHTLRHAYATYLRSKGVEIQTISELLGHSQITTTQIYARMTDVQRQKSVNDAFNCSVSTPMPMLKPTQPNQNLSPREYLQMQMLHGEINEQEYLKKLTLLNPEGIKRVVEIRE